MQRSTPRSIVGLHMISADISSRCRSSDESNSAMAIVGRVKIRAREIARRRDARGKNRDHSKFTESLESVFKTLSSHLGLVGKVAH